MELDTGFKDRVRWAINSARSNQSELARAIKTTPQAIQQWVSGATQSPRRDFLMLAAEHLGVRFEWLAYGRGPMKDVPQEPLPKIAHGDVPRTEAALLSHEWESLLLAALPATEREHWQVKLAHPSGVVPMRISWCSDTILAELGLYQSTTNLIHNARHRLWLLAIAREQVPPSTSRRAILLLAPLEDYEGKHDSPDRHIAVLRAEARLLNIEVVHVHTPEEAAAALTNTASAAETPLADELGIDVSSVL